jgi:Sulfotransferase family
MSTPIFIFSLPRSGSTLLQRLLSSHDDIATVAEPWVLLPLFYSLRKDGTLSEYSHKHSYKALSELYGHLPEGRGSILKAFGHAAQEIYDLCACNGERYFLDKTPRYYNIIPEIVAAFPEAKFVFLFRNPLDVLASVTTTWHAGSLSKLYLHIDDLNLGYKLLADGYESLKDKASWLYYEDLVENSEKELATIFEHLNLKSAPVVDLDQYTFSGSLGDQTGKEKYSKVSEQSNGAWKKVFKTRSKKRFLVSYLKSLDQSALTTLGYERDKLLSEVEAHSVSFNLGVVDFCSLAWVRFVLFLKPNLWLSKRARKLTKNSYFS